MPAQRPRAQFEPVAPNVNVQRLVEAHDHFDFCPRIPYDLIEENGVDNLEKLVRKHVIQGGKPLVIEGVNAVLDPWTFSAKWLKDNVGDKVENARDLHNKEFIPLTIKHYLTNMRLCANQHFVHRSPTEDPAKIRPPQRIYLKDIDCPEIWQQKLADVIPPFLYYLNDSTGEPGGPGAKVLNSSAAPGRRLGKGIAPAGDLMSSFPPEMRAENLMCYIGHEGTYTPAHREMCATMGHNLMVDASADFDEDGKPERPGSSIWFMTAACDRQLVSEFWLSKLGHDIEVEDHFAQINSWKAAPFKVYIVEQRPGDFILIPPLAPHQVWNRGTRTMKVAWNRSTVDTLEMSIKEAIPKAKIVCRDEQYKNKAMVYFTLMKYSDLLSEAKRQADKLPQDAAYLFLHKGKLRQLQRDFRRLFELFKQIMLSEMFPPDGGEKCEYLPFESNVTCAYCRGNVFNRFLSCLNCKDALGQNEEELYDVCMECYAMGRSCFCTSGHQWTEQFKWKELAGKYDQWRKQVIDLEGDIYQSSPLPLAEERKRLGKKTLAEVVREELKKRPFVDPSKPSEEQEDNEPSDEEVIVDDEGRVKKRIRKHSKTWLKNHSLCHICRYRHPNWKMARCTRCDRWWCYGSVFRGHDDMPLDIMENPDWECAHCQNVCFAGACRKDPRQNPYEPKGTLLGHDTKIIADARSIEALVDFSMSNLNWIRDDGEQESAQMRRALEESEKARVEAGDDEEDADGHRDAPTDDPGEYTPIVDDEDTLLDPELRQEQDLVNRLTAVNRSQPQVRAEIDRQSGDALSGYVPADTAGYNVGNHHDDYDGDAAYMYPDPMQSEDVLPGSGNEFGEFGIPLEQGQQPREPGERAKRARASDGDVILMEPFKKRRVTEQLADVLAARATNEASRQYRGIKERKALDEARRNGRYFSVSAALRGKTKIVRIKVPKEQLRRIVAASRSKGSAKGPAASRASAEEHEPADLLRSDIRPVAAKVMAKPVKQKKRKKHDSDEEEDDPAQGQDDLDPELDEPQVVRSTTKDGRRRISAYLARRHADEDLPDELPSDFRDGRHKDRDPKPGSAYKPMPERGNGGQWLPNKDKPAATSTGKPRGRPRKVPIVPAFADHPKTNGHNSGASQSITEEEKNRLAKLEALKSMTNNGDGDDHDDVDALDDDIGAIASAAFALPEQRAPVAKMMSGTAQTEKGAATPATNGQLSGGGESIVRRSIFDRGGPGGKKIKIVSAAKAGKA